MLKIIKKIFSINLTKNTLALFLVQIVNLGAPFLVYAFLSRQLGTEGFGILMICLSVCAIGVVITDFGFGLSATHEISKNRADNKYVSEIMGAVFIIKSALLTSLLFILLCYAYFIGLDAGYAIVIFINVITQSFIPTWFFLGIEKMINITIFTVVTKLVYVALIFAMINHPDDIGLVILIQAMTNLFTVFMSLIAIYKYRYRITFPDIQIIKQVFVDSAQYFYSRITLSFYTSASVLFVGFFSGAQQAAVFGAAEKLYLASQSITTPVAQALFPYMSNNGKPKILRNVILFVGTPLGAGCLLLGFWGEEIMGLIFGAEFYLGGRILQIFLIITAVNFISVNLGFPAFASLNKIYIANYTIILGALIHIICLGYLYFTKNVSGLNVVLSILITELSIMSLRSMFYRYYFHRHFKS